MKGKKKSTDLVFSQEQRAQIGNACERVQNAININNSTLAQLNADLVRKADEIAIKWKAYGLPYNAIRDAAIEMALWQKEQMMKSAIEVKINRDTLYNLKPIIHEKYQDLKIGDKILIIKEDEHDETIDYYSGLNVLYSLNIRAD